MLGASLHALGRRDEALAAFLQVLALDPGVSQAYLAAATVLSESGRYEEALACCYQAVERDPGNPGGHTNLGIVCEALGRREEALISYGKALAADAAWGDALRNRAALLLSLDRGDEALVDAKHLVALQPQRAEAHCWLGEAYLAARDYAEAAEAFSSARRLSAAPGDVRPLLHGGFALAMQRKFIDAQILFDEAWRENGKAVLEYRRKIFSSGAWGDGALDARTLYLLALYDQAERCEWESGATIRERWMDVLRIADPLPSDRALGFRAMALGLPLEQQLRLALRIAEALPEKPAPRKAAVFLGGRRLRIGYLSPDFRDHAVGQLARGLFGWHDRQRVEVFSYSIGPADDGPVRQQIVAGSDIFRDLTGLFDRQAADRIRADGIDILIDLAGYTDYARPGIFAHRPAPLQVSWMGYLATTGAKWMDYIVLDPVVAPAGDDRFYSEAVIRLPETTRLCSYAREFPRDIPTREAAGLPGQGRVLAAFHNGYKIEPSIFGIWMRLLQAAPDAVLWILGGAPEMIVNLRREAVRLGIEAERLVVAPRKPLAEHLARFALADFFLDTLWCNGGTTVCDALVAGVPVLTCADMGYAGRMAATALLAAGFPEGVTYDPSAYEKKAMAWLDQPSELERLRRQIVAQRDLAPFYSPERWVSQFETALLAAWEIHCAGMPAAAIGGAS